MYRVPDPPIPTMIMVSTRHPLPSPKWLLCVQTTSEHTILTKLQVARPSNPTVPTGLPMLSFRPGDCHPGRHPHHICCGPGKQALPKVKIQALTLTRPSDMTAVIQVGSTRRTRALVVSSCALDLHLQASRREIHPSQSRDPSDLGSHPSGSLLLDNSSEASSQRVHPLRARPFHSSLSLGCILPRPSQPHPAPSNHAN